jgi:hypothetical protein
MNDVAELQAPPAWKGSMLASQARFAAATLVATVVAGWLLTFAFKGERDGAAILTSGVLAVAIQVAAFPMLRRLARTNLIGAMGAGMAIRFGSLIVYAILAAKVLLIPPAPALISLAVFYFLSMVFEPLFFRF